MKPEVDNAGHGERAALENCVHPVERQCAEHKHELQRFRDTGQEDRSRSGDHHGLVLCPVLRLHPAVDRQGDAEKKACGADHLANLEAGRRHRGEEVRIGSGIARVLKVDEIRDPGEPQRILSEHLGPGAASRKDRVGASERGIVHGNGQHVVQAEGEQQTLQSAVDKRGKNGGGGAGVRDPHAEIIDAALDHRPHYA